MSAILQIGIHSFAGYPLAAQDRNTPIEAVEVKSETIEALAEVPEPITPSNEPLRLLPGERQTSGNRTPNFAPLNRINNRLQTRLPTRIDNRLELPDLRAPLVPADQREETSKLRQSTSGSTQPE